MADAGAHRIRKDFKFEIFLKRHLEPEEYERVRFYDFCVITSRKEDRAYKYVVLTDEWIYLTENPPKTVTKEVQLRDVVAIEWMRDFPDFLDGDLKQNAQHVCIKYLYTSNSKRSRRERLSPANQGDTLNTTRSFRSDFNSTESTVGLASARSTLRPTGVVPPLKFNDENDDLDQNTNDPNIQEVEQVPSNKGGACSCLPCCKPNVPKLVINDEYAVEHNEGLEMEDEESATNRQENGVIGSDTRRSLRLKLDDLPTSTPRKSFREASQRSSRMSTRGDGDQRKVGELHIYLLNGETPILLLLRSAWNTCMLRGTRLMDEDYEKRCTPRGKVMQDESIAFLFARLKNELFEAAPYLDASFELTNELMNATQRNFMIKKLFWKNSDMFRFLLKRLKTYLPRSKAKFHTSEGRIQRTDELDYCVLVMDTLKLMLQETETMPARNNCLRGRGGEECLELIDVLTGEVAMPDEYQPLSNAAAKLLNQTALEMELRKVDRELDQLMDEVTTSGAAILYEVLVTGRNVSDGPADALPSESRIVKRIESSDSMEEYLRRLIEHTLHLIIPTHSKTRLKPMQAVEVFQQFSVLRSLVVFSREIKVMIQENYIEEFKYFVQAPVVMRKLSRQYLITWPALGVIEEVTGVITGKENLFNEDEEYLAED